MIPCDGLLCGNSAAYVGGKSIASSRNLCIPCAFRENPRLVLTLTAAQLGFLESAGAGRVNPDQLERERKRRQGSRSAPHPKARRYHARRAATGAERIRALRKRRRKRKPTGIGTNGIFKPPQGQPENARQ